MCTESGTLLAMAPLLAMVVFYYENLRQLVAHGLRCGWRGRDFSFACAAMLASLFPIWYVLRIHLRHHQQQQQNK